MITKRDLEEAIAECQGQRNPNANTCIKLAAFLTIQQAMYGEQKEPLQQPGYSYLPDPGLIENQGTSEFARTIDGRRQEEIWPLMDELMDTIHAIHPRLYAALMDRLR